MATHKLQITFDEAAGTVTAVHRCAVEVGGHAVSHAEPVELDPGAAAALKAVLDGPEFEVDVPAVYAAAADPEGEPVLVSPATTRTTNNRAEMERVTTGLAIAHAAAAADKPKKGVKQIRLGGTLGAVGAADAKKS